MGIATRDVESFLEHYGRAQTESAEATAALWSVPGMVIDLYDEPLASTDRGALVGALAPAYPIYERLGLTGIRLVGVDVSEATETVVLARTHWSFLAGEEVLTDPVFEYAVRRDGDDLSVCFAIAVDLAEKIDRVARRRGVDLS